MAIQQIQYDDKEAINIDSAVPDKNKCKADDLNEIKNVVNNNSYETPKVSSQVDTDYKVNVLTTKNLFNKDNAVLLNLYFDDNDVLQASPYNKLIYIPCKPNTTYTLQKTASPATRQIGYTTEYPAVNVQAYGKIVIATNGTSGTITTGANAKYLVCRFYQTSQDTSVTIPQMLSSIQIEYGSEATPYEPFIQNTINVNNEKYTDTINVGATINDKNRVNILYSKNLFDKNNIEAGYLSNAGNVISNANFSTSNFIELNGATKITIDNSTGQNENVCFYNSSKTFISYQATGTNTTMTIDVPNGAEYVRTTIGNANLNIYIVQEGNSIITPSINIDGETIVNKNVYSSSEVVIGEWLGKPLYRKAINIGALTNASLKTTAHGISNIDIIYKATGITYDSGYNFFPLPFSSKVANENISLYANRTNIYTNCGTDRTSFTTTYIVLEYTKTTD